VNRVDPSGLDVCAFECTCGYHHTWVEFDGDANRTYGFRPHGQGKLAGGFGLAKPGRLTSSDDSGRDAQCDAGPGVCRSWTPEQDAQVEQELKQSLSSQWYFFGISDCRIVSDIVDSKLVELQGRENFWRDIGDLLFNLR
jgi:hypothetical protein